MLQERYWTQFIRLTVWLQSYKDKLLLTRKAHDVLGKSIVSLEDLKKSKENFTDQFHLDFNQFIQVGEENRQNEWTKQDLTDTHQFICEAERLLKKEKDAPEKKLSFLKAPEMFTDAQIESHKAERPKTAANRNSKNEPLPHFPISSYVKEDVMAAKKRMEKRQ